MKENPRQTFGFTCLMGGAGIYYLFLMHTSDCLARYNKRIEMVPIISVECQSHFIFNPPRQEIQHTSTASEDKLLFLFIELNLRL